MKQAARAQGLRQIPTTTFFCVPEQFEALRDVVYPAMLKDRSPADTIRLWVPGCRTGEEAYSHAIALLEYLEASRADCSLQIFGPDVSETDIDSARWGLYGKSACRDIGSTRLQRFFTVVKGGYRVKARVRDKCVFARQNICTDPPFS